MVHNLSPILPENQENHTSRVARGLWAFHHNIEVLERTSNTLRTLTTAIT